MTWKVIVPELDALLKDLDSLKCAGKIKRQCRQIIQDHVYLSLIPKLSVEIAKCLPDDCKPCLQGVEPPRLASDWLGVLGCLPEASRGPGELVADSNEDLEPAYEDIFY